MLAPDTLPWYFAIPGAIIAWGIYIGIRVAEIRERHALEKILDEADSKR